VILLVPFAFGRFQTPLLLVLLNVQGGEGIKPTTPPPSLLNLLFVWLPMSLAPCRRADSAYYMDSLIFNFVLRAFYGSNGSSGGASSSNG